jgi:hypothetical protein
MSLYSILVLVHVAGGVGLFVALGIEGVAVARLRRAVTPDDARTWAGMLAVPRRVGPVAMLSMLAAGVWMMARWWGPRPWILAALIGVVAVAAVGGIMSGRGTRRLVRALAEESGHELSAAYRALRVPTVLGASFSLRLAIATGILVLMTIKPGVAGSSLTMVAAALTGMAAALRLHADSNKVAGSKPAGERRAHISATN